jgi:HicA toxin of bacterial toxin-antitoxin,
MRSKKREWQRSILENPATREFWESSNTLATLLTTIAVDFDEQPMEGLVINDMITFAQLEELETKDYSRLNQRQVDDLADMAAIYELLVRLRSSTPSFTRVGMKDMIDRSGGRIHLPPHCLQRESWRHVLSWIKVHEFGYPGGEKAIESSKRMGPYIRKFAELPRNNKPAINNAFAAMWDEIRRHRNDVLEGLGHPLDDLVAEQKRISYDKRPEHLQHQENLWSCQRDQERANNSLGAAEVDHHRHKSVAELSMLQSCPKKAVAKHTGPKQNSLPRVTHSQIISESSEEYVNVSGDSYKILEMMWPSTGDKSSRLQSVPWTQLVQAMVDIGCTVQNSGGSAVSFRRAGNTIVIHRPHPDPRVDSISMRNIGKRLTKWMNLSLENFRSPWA